MDDDVGATLALRELRHARQILENLWPRETPQLPGFQVGGWNQAAAMASGDIFDWLALPDGRALISIADVTGHGLGPALFAVSYRAYLRACAGAFSELEALIPRVDALMARDLPQGHFVAATIGIVDASAGSVALCCAGHGVGMHYRAADGVVEHLEVHRPPLGLGLALPSSEMQMTALAPGDVLMLVTDGFYEWRDAAGEEFGVDRLSEALDRHWRKPPSELIEAAYEEVVAFAQDERQRDDLTALVVRRSPLAARHV